ncbi:MAG TPA: SDR family NAD(P)-dependent oxidoreductase [Solirubrobacterales bacterium]|jgi:short-subunit dehydrogenase|nr:SDR family NAD(P)-dependent oxidoreductase [Solirubrobacterales bacterium]
MEIAARTALLTGATGGLGRAIAKDLAGAGATLVLSGRREEDLLALAESLPGDDHRVVVADLAEDGEAERLAEAAAGVDILVANAGLPGAGWLAEFSAEEVKRALRVNLESPMLLARALFPEMLERGSGHLVFVSSLSGKSASPRTSVYNATKFGLRGFALGLRADLSPRGLGVSLVSPGFVRDAGMFADSGGKTPPMMGTATPTGVADAVRRAIVADKVEIAVAPMLDRALAHVGLVSPSAALRAQSGSVGQRAAAAVTDGEKDKR